MESQNVKVVIANREYNLRVAPNDAPLLEKAAAALRQRIQNKQERMRIYDKQDLLAMVAFDMVVEELAARERLDALCQKMIALEQLIPELS
ncbi:MAG: cell division protein ZapA [Cytophagales bacterium]|nr:cell division protein ZapA [Bernardetiaceae bacterium]MDW8205898.1 cell division protein ZapA [Cytophagales bacterium]